MAQNYIQPGNVVTVTAPSGGVISGTPYKIGGLIGVALGDADAADSFELALTGIWTMPKATGTAWSEGDALYWDDSAKKFTKTASANTFAGIATEAAGSSDATGKVLLVKNSGSQQAANVAQNATAAATDLTTTEALANSLKTSLNAILTALKNAGIMVAD